MKPAAKGEVIMEKSSVDSRILAFLIDRVRENKPSKSKTSL